MSEHVATREDTEPVGEALAATDSQKPKGSSSSDPAHSSSQRKAARGSRFAEVRRWWPVALAAVVAVASLLGPIASSGIWDPYELKTAELGRRIAVALLGGQDLSLEGAVNTVPTAGEIGRGELPLTSIAIGFRLFGLHDWAGRLPLALWGLMGVGATFLLLRRLSDSRAASFAAIVLSTTPLYFLQSRTLLGDIVTMAGVALATTGLSLGVFDDRSSRVRQAAWLGLGLAGLGAGFGARGVLVGVAVPALGVGLAWLISGGTARARSSWKAATGAAVLLLGLVAVCVGVAAVLKATDQEFSRLVGTAVDRARRLPTHDFIVLQLGHGLFPYSAVVPLAMGRLFRAPEGLDAGAVEREAVLRLVVSLVAVLGLAAHGFIAPTVGNVAYGPVFALAAVVALAFRDIERTNTYSMTMALGIVALAILLFADFKNFPEKGLSAFVVDGASFPDSFKVRATKTLQYATIGAALLLIAAFAEPAARAGVPFDRRAYTAWPRALRRAYSGNLLITLLVAEAALIMLALLTFLSDRWFHWEPFQKMGLPVRQLAKFGYLVVPGLVVAPWGVLLARDASRALFRRLPIARGAIGVLSLAAVGAILSFGYYPALASQLSPKEVFESYREFAEPDEELAMVGVGGGSASYYAGGDVKTLASVHQAFAWLSEPVPGRRWLIVRSNDLGKLNSLYRGKFEKNLPVLDGRSSEILLVSSRLKEGEHNDNPLGRWVLDERPEPTRRLDVNLSDQLRVLGWDVTDLEGEPVESVRPGKRYQFRIYYNVLRPITGDWETFIHIDGYQRRYNGDHETLDGKYPFSMWKPGDFIADIHEFELEPNFTPGAYEVFFGLFRGSRRLEVKSGRHHENRVIGGRLPVR